MVKNVDNNHKQNPTDVCCIKVAVQISETLDKNKTRAAELNATRRNVCRESVFNVCFLIQLLKCILS